MTALAPVDPLTHLAMWTLWQDRVRAGLPQFAASPLYVEQDSLAPADVEQVAHGLRRDPFDPQGMARDVAHGARPFPTARGTVTRQWLDGNIEIDFLARRLPARFAAVDVLDIGAGYGRLAVMLAPLVRTYTCVDPVPLSVEVCRTYTQQYAPTVTVLDVAGLRVAMAQPTFRPTLAINIHSWNECTRAQITGWLDVLEALAVPFLFTVSHAASYYAWEAGQPSFKPLLQDRYALVAEEAIGLSGYPYALWARRERAA